ncbi:MAG: homocysteine S-methyltransferase family protein [Clostridia bacterium]|nr:homocysteine S-methyltransferase family protein [Clostridia bacterium]
MNFKNLQFFDGGFGSLLQKRGLQPGEKPEAWNISHPDAVLAIHKEYLQAGSDIITTNTFGANALKYDDPASVIRAGVQVAKQAVAQVGYGKVALDIGPTGKLLEPFGPLGFEDCVDLFKQQIGAGCTQADLIIIETMSDLQEARAAVLAAKETCSLPIFVTLSFGEDGRLLTGASVEVAVAVLEGMGVDAIGLNCGLGPVEMLPLAKRMAAVTSLPIILNPNAGMPVLENGETVYKITPEIYAQAVGELLKVGVAFVGGCCGTTPDYIKALHTAFSQYPFVVPSEKSRTVIASNTKTVVLEDKPVVIGERINPTGKPKLKEALRNADMDYVVREAMTQEEHGADILDVNVGAPGVNEKEVLPQCIRVITQTVTLPLQIDTADPAAMEQALRCYCGKALINSVNGKQESMDAVFPLVKKYGGCAVCLTLDENGIPETADGRLRIAEKIVREAERYGIARSDLLIDTLTLSVSTKADNAIVTLESLRRVRFDMGLHTVLGVSNVSFGLPDRPGVNAAFLTLAMQNGLSAAIINPLSRPERTAVLAFRALNAMDENCENYIAFASDAPAQAVAEETVQTLAFAVRKGLAEKAAELAKEMLKSNDALQIINAELIPALTAVGEAFEKKTLFLPQLLSSAKAAQSAFAVLRENGKQTENADKKIVFATVKGDIHDIGKNIVTMLLSNYGFTVIDLGKDVPPQTVAETVVENGVKLVGLSALMTTTLPAMEETVKLLRAVKPDCKVMVGGAVVTQEYADSIGAHFYGKDAMEAVHIAQTFFDDN